MILKQLERINIKREMMNTNTGHGKNAYAFCVRERCAFMTINSVARECSSILSLGVETWVEMAHSLKL